MSVSVCVSLCLSPELCVSECGFEGLCLSVGVSVCVLCTFLYTCGILELYQSIKIRQFINIFETRSTILFRHIICSVCLGSSICECVCECLSL